MILGSLLVSTRQELAIPMAGQHAEEDLLPGNFVKACRLQTLTLGISMHK